MKKGSTLKILKSNPYAGINRIRLLGYNLSPSSGHPFFIRGAKVIILIRFFGGDILNFYQIAQKEPSLLCIFA